LGGLALAVLVHVGALLGINGAERHPWVWGLHMGIFLVFIPAVYTSKAGFKRNGRPTFSELREGVPDWLVALGAVLILYAIANFFLSAAVTEGGQPAMRAGKFVLLNHGKFVREITAGEYAALNTNALRLFSGHWMIFYFMSFAMLKYRKAKP
jgi:hypothetical protein